ncbi:hypothetical protein OSB04_012308 [Centaurea solstitialis]|uniref:Uncharacterized protein n=1 Tax=Centaurea solstitialis TaxID=347529 RepID=A0AA38TCU9_9ASTR|nr:hypothetical protein OSB04_012308 [Centaurea solstitialis]
MMNCNLARTLADTSSKLDDSSAPISDPTLYHSLAGALQYLTFTQPDIALGGCPSTRRSTSGYCVFLGDNVISWSSKRQNTTSRSSAEAGYRGVLMRLQNLAGWESACALFHACFSPKHTKHPLYGLSFDDSRRLLCWHAFRSNHPKEVYEEETTKVAKYCGGHPLALKVLGSSLMNEDLLAWSDTYEMLVNKELNTDVQKVLRFSYGSLPSENFNELFKDIAFFCRRR